MISKNPDRRYYASILVETEVALQPMDCYGEATKSHAIGDLEEIPVALQKMTSKIERSSTMMVGPWEWASYVL
jgi:hypothetical protein